MNIAIAAREHPVKLDRPYYGLENGAQLHRYLEPEFIARFQQQLGRHELDSPDALAWRQEDRFSPHDDRLVLRLPLHRAFHVVSCEAVCDRVGFPALDPQRVTSAGFVIRRVGGAREQAWTLKDGEALGWREVSGEGRDPDIYRRLCANGVLRKRSVAPAFSGEETHPLHPVTHFDRDGKRHTVLYGYLPLGGFHYLLGDDQMAPFDADSAQDVRDAVGAMLPWPYGYRRPLKQAWLEEHARPVDRGRPAKGFYELLRMLADRYHLGETGIPENEGLEALTRRIYFYDDSGTAWRDGPLAFSDATRDRFRAHRKFSLWDYLEACFARTADNPLVSWLIGQEAEIEARGGLAAVSRLDRLPARPPAADNLAWSLYTSPADAQELRELLGQRVMDQALNKAREIPLPKFQQGADDIYQVVPFVRALDKAGKEQLIWAGRATRSEPFRVAAPFDPEASRPSLIQMPGLADLKRGLAKGASMITPPDTFNLIDALKLNKGASADAVPEEAPSGGLGLQWICSFSLPVITLVAMILLMIMISLLNIVFFWLPWVRICLPFPKLNR